MRRRTGTVYRSKCGTHWVIRATKPGGARSGPIHLEPSTSHEAAREAAQRLSDVFARGDAVPTTADLTSPATIADVVKLWVPLVQASALAPATKAQHLTFARGAISKRFGSSPPALRVADLRAWLRQLREGSSISRVRNCFFSLSKMLDDAMAEDWIKLDANPLRHPKVLAELPKLADREDSDRARHTEQEASRVLVATTAPEWRLRYLLAWTTGMRDGELAGLRWSDVDVEHGIAVLRVRTAIAHKGPEGHATRKGPKTRSSRRTIPLHPLALKRLQAWRETGWAAFVGRAPTDDDPVLPSSSGAPSRPRSAARFREDLAAARLSTTFEGKDFEFRSTRRSFATWLDAHGVAADTADRLLGHAPQSTRTRHYTGADLRGWAAAVASIVIVDGPIVTAIVTGGGSGPLARTWNRRKGGGGEEIRTPGRLSTSAVFKTVGSQEIPANPPKFGPDSHLAEGENPQELGAGDASVTELRAGQALLASLDLLLERLLEDGES